MILITVQEAYIPSVFEFMNALLSQTSTAFNGIANDVFSVLLGYLVKPSTENKRPCHLLLKRILLNGRTNPKPALDLLQVAKSSKLSPYGISCFIEYLSILCSYEPCVLKTVADPIQQVISLLKPISSPSQVNQLRDLENM